MAKVKKEDLVYLTDNQIRQYFKKIHNSIESLDESPLKEMLLKDNNLVHRVNSVLHTIIIERFLRSNDDEVVESDDLTKQFYTHRSVWDEHRDLLTNVSDDDVNWSKDENGTVIALWSDLRSEGWIKNNNNG